MKHLTHLMYQTIVSMVSDILNNQDYGMEKHEYIDWLKQVREAAEVLEFNASGKIEEIRNREQV